MKKKNLLLTLSMCTMLALGSTVYATSANNLNTSKPAAVENNNSQRSYNEKGLGLRRITGKKGYDFMASVIKDKLKVSDEEINKALAEGKTLKDFAKEKGLSEEDLKKALVDSKSKAIDESVAKGTLTKEEGEKIKTRIKENSKNCTLDNRNGRKDPSKRQGGKQGKGRMGQGQGQGRGQDKVQCTGDCTNGSQILK
ncbi:hypothetical protein [Haloimpatiens lingqiaonensis]|uniref:hypothetical protein n=1 Tax=Haloimpatiens lingqiaonensis TaxID=1380675 RepID=UPI0010FE3E87|nr:hypothetical protein [Haloimpatiens lingqiaonensis]